MRYWLQIALACVLIAAIAILCIAPAYAVMPTALRAWNSSMTILAALCTLVIFALAAPVVREVILFQDRIDHAPRTDRFRLTCTLLI